MTRGTLNSLARFSAAVTVLVIRLSGLMQELSAVIQYTHCTFVACAAVMTLIMCRSHDVTLTDGIYVNTFRTPAMALVNDLIELESTFTVSVPSISSTNFTMPGSDESRTPQRTSNCGTLPKADATKKPMLPVDGMTKKESFSKSSTFSNRTEAVSKFAMYRTFAASKIRSISSKLTRPSS